MIWSEGRCAASDAEGRVLTVDVEGVRVVNVYAPHSHRRLIRLDAKLAFLSAFTRFVEQQMLDGVPLVLLGDFNIAHREIDLANPVANAKNAGFLPAERECSLGIFSKSKAGNFWPK